MSRGQQSGQSGEVVCGHRQDEAGAHPFYAAIHRLGHSTGRLGVTEGLLDPFAVLDGQNIVFVTGRPSVRCPAYECLHSPRGESGMPRFLGDMRGHAGLPEVCDEVGAVIPHVCSQRQPMGRSGRMARGAVAQLRPLRIHNVSPFGQTGLMSKPSPARYRTTSGAAKSWVTADLAGQLHDLARAA